MRRGRRRGVPGRAGRARDLSGRLPVIQPLAHHRYEMDVAQRAPLVQVQQRGERPRKDGADAVNVRICLGVGRVRGVRPLRCVRRPVHHRRADAAQSEQDQQQQSRQGGAEGQRRKSGGRTGGERRNTKIVPEQVYTPGVDSPDTVFPLRLFPPVAMRFVLSAALFCLLAGPALAQPDVTWDVLARVKVVQDGALYVPQFEPAVARFDGKRVVVRGFMVPLQQAPKQQHFLLSSFPAADCFFCLPGGPESFIEIKLDKAVDFEYEPVNVTGVLRVMTDDPGGMYYRLDEARVQS